MPLDQRDADKAGEQQTSGKTTIMLGVSLRKWLRHYALDHDTSLRQLVVTILTDWARERGYKPDTNGDTADVWAGER
jgi:hypothetical protein